jgi:hypothetical protein
MKEGDMLYPVIRMNTTTGQLELPLWGNHPALLVEKVLYENNNPIDCQDESIEDWRWVVLQDGDVMWMSETLIRQFFEYR